MAKKRKLNSRNPKWNKDNKQEVVENKLLCEVKGAKIYLTFKK